MTRREPPRLALALLEHFAPNGTFLAGDLIEEYRHHPSRWRVWREVLAALAAALRRRDDEIRPLHLVDLQPADAIARTSSVLRPKPINLAASPIAGTGGLTIAILALVATLFMPGVWWLLGVALLAGIGLGVLLIGLHRRNIG
jgi:hypothetical protein